MLSIFISHSKINKGHFYKKLYTDVNHYVVSDKKLAFKGTEKQREILLNYYQYNLNHHLFHCDIIYNIIYLLQNDLLSLLKLYCTSKIFHSHINKIKQICVCHDDKNYNLLFNKLTILTVKNYNFKKNNHILQLIQSNPLTTLFLINCRYNKIHQLLKILKRHTINHIHFEYNTNLISSSIIFDLLINPNLTNITFFNMQFNDYLFNEHIYLYWNNELAIHLFAEQYLDGPSDDYFKTSYYQNCHIKNLKLIQCQLDSIYFIRLMIFLCHTEIEYINISDNNIIEDYGDLVLKSLKLFKKLKFLNLSGNNISQQQLNKWRKVNNRVKIIYV